MIGKIIGAIVAIAGIIGGAYLGLYVMLFGGIVDIIGGLNPLDAVAIAWGILKVLFCEVGALVAWIGTAVGMSIAAID